MSLHCQQVWQMWRFGTHTHTHTYTYTGANGRTQTHTNSHHKLLPADLGELLTSTHMIMENWRHWGRQISSWAGKNRRQTDGHTESLVILVGEIMSFFVLSRSWRGKGKKKGKTRCSLNRSNLHVSVAQSAFIHVRQSLSLRLMD